MPRALATYVMALALAGCVGGPPSVVESDDDFVTVLQPRHTPQRQVKALAEESCARYGREAAFLTEQCVDPQCSARTQKFWCR